VSEQTTPTTTDPADGSDVDVPQRTPEQIQAEMNAIRAQMTQTVDLLVAEVQPARIVQKTTDAAKQKATETLAHATATLRAARQGDSAALKQVGYAVAGVAVVAGLVVLRAARRHR